MFVFLGETGDTDHEELLSGTHKTIMLKGLVTEGSERLMRVGGSYHRTDVAPADSPYSLTSECNVDQMSNALKKLSANY
jgi:sucrose-phosphate synthase